MLLVTILVRQVHCIVLVTVTDTTRDYVLVVRQEFFSRRAPIRTLPCTNESKSNSKSIPEMPRPDSNVRRNSEHSWSPGLPIDNRLPTTSTQDQSLPGLIRGKRFTRNRFAFLVRILLEQRTKSASKKLLPHFFTSRLLISLYL